MVFGGEYEVESVGSQFVNLIGVRGGMYTSHFTSTPTITIEPGKHYRLRNGKVTGRVSIGDIGFEAIVDGQVKVFDRAGGAVFGGEDIVEAWVPKVGERVRAVNETSILVAGREYEVERVEQDYVFVDRGEFGVADYPLSYFEPLLVAAPAQPAVLTIQQGKFYKTRDGRKVGPMEERCESCGTEYVWHHDRGRRIYKADGTNYDPGANDLIAEWVDEPVVAVANDNVEAAKPKFKVVGGRQYVGEFGTVFNVIKNPHNNRHWPLCSDEEAFETRRFWKEDGTAWDGYRRGRVEGLASEFVAAAPSAIVALIEDGAAKPSSKPKVHASQADATDEAERLALAHPGQLFGVFVLADSKIADVVNVPTPVLRAA
ncbi:hypothetical protein BTE77_06860 [Ensifer adhaerens]|nr:hypothetical protein BTE77_06860 [Ensifer adhaerens]